ncbi:MAG TPA: hypothetical protein VN605_12330 [Thermoanaerobaculia bacterium]|nr:hypothetical protein [Thermoanaerobaculia bacterium]
MRLFVENLARSITHAELNNIGLVYDKVLSANVATTLSNGQILKVSEAGAPSTRIAGLRS